MELTSPAYNKTEFYHKNSDYALCVPVINEGQKIIKQITSMQAIADKIDIIIADGGSSDGSLEPEFLKKNKISTLLTKTGPGKLSAQMRMAMSYCLNRGYQGIVFIDGNNKDDPTQFSRFTEKLDDGYDHIQGSRFIEGGEHQNTPLIRLLAVRLLHAPLISLAAGFCYTDTTNGFRAYSRKLLLDPKINVFREVFSTYELHYYLAIEAARNNYKVTEVPVSRRYPKGKVPSKINSWQGYLNILRILFKSCLGGYRK